MTTYKLFIIMILIMEIGLLIFGLFLFFKTIKTEYNGIDDKKELKGMYKLEIEINDRIKKDLENFILEQKTDIVVFSETCGDFATLDELEEDFKIYDIIESRLWELKKQDKERLDK